VSFEELPGTALITGASAGIGAEYARQLAAHGFDLILSARRAERLEELAEGLSGQHGISVDIHPADLTKRSEVEGLEQRIRGESKLVILVNNAGFGVSGKYASRGVENHQRMIDVHVTATVRLTHAALSGMIERRRGYVINVSSIAGFIPVGGGPGYAASKAYLNVFSTNLQSTMPEFIRVQALCPGYTYTEFHTTPDYNGNEREVLPRWVWMTAEDVVRYSLSKLDTKKVIVVPGFKYRVVAFLLRTGIGGALMALRGRFLGVKERA
jgi:short-subunit dehydrogenase